MKKVKDHPDLIKIDGAVLNINEEQYLIALQRQKNVRRERELDERLFHLENAVSDILTLLKEKL